VQCRRTDDFLAVGNVGQRSDDIVIRHTFLGFTGPATVAHVTVIPAAGQ
jgi:hypothetical protein